MPDSFSNLSNDQPTPISIREYGDVLRRRRAIILQTFVIVLVAGVLVTLFQTPVYHASGRLLLEPPTYTINSVNGSDPLADLLRVGSAYSIPTQVELLQTDTIRKEVQDKIPGKVLPPMTVSPVEGTSIIQIDAEGDDPETVADAPNKLMSIYCDEEKGNSGKSLNDALDFTGKNVAASEKRLKAADDALLAFKTRNNIQELGPNESAQVQLVNGLNGEYENATQQIAVLNARIAATEAAKQQAGEERITMLSYFEDPAIQAIENEISNVTIQLDTLVGVPGGFTAQDSSIIRLNRQLADLHKRETVLTNQFKLRNTHLNPTYISLADNLLQDKIQQSELRVKQLGVQSQLHAAKDRLAKFPNWAAEYDKLQRADASAKQSLELFSSKQSDLSLRSHTLHNGASIIEPASVPTQAIRPKRAQNIIIGGLLGLFLGLCLALLQELFDDRINNPEEAERVLRVPTLGHIPMIEEEGLRLIRDISTFSPLMEAYRSLRTNINFAAVGSEMRSIVITSSVPAEGKSTTVANLAMAMALDNKRVIVVDADLRRPSLHKLFKKDASPGLTDLLIGTHTVDEVIQETNVEGVRFIAAGSPPPNPAELLGSSAMGHILEVLEQSCDIVLFDSPPTLAVADGVVLASRTDGAVLLIGYGETKKTSSKKAIEILSRANANLLGVILNRIEGPAGGYYYGKYYIPATDRAGVNRPGNRSFDAAPAATPLNLSAPQDTASDEDELPRALPENQEDER